MKKLELWIVFLLVAFMAIGASAATLTEGGNFVWDYGAVGHWDDSDGQNWRDSNAYTGAFVDEPSAETINLATGAWPINIAGPTAVCTVDTAIGGWASTTSGTGIRVYEGATMNVVAGADLYGFGSIRVGDIRSTPNAAYLNQTGGRISLTRQMASGRLAIGDANMSPNGGMLSGSTYTISGGTFTYDAADPKCAGELILGYRNGYGQMTIVGTAPDIHIKYLYIAGDHASDKNPYDYGTGILEYQIGSDGVSPIAVNGIAYIDQGDLIDTDGDGIGDTQFTTAQLILTLTAAPPTGDILLIDCVNIIQGTFDTVTGDINGGKGQEGDTIILTYGGIQYQYTLTYKGGTDGKDLVLLIPEPATICLLGLGALSLIRRKR